MRSTQKLKKVLMLKALTKLSYEIDLIVNDKP